MLSIKAALSRGTVADIVTRLRTEVRGIVVRFPAGTRVFALLKSFHIDSADHQGVPRALCSDWGEMLKSEGATHIHLFPRLRKSVAQQLTPKHIIRHDAQRGQFYRRKDKLEGLHYSSKMSVLMGYCNHGTARPQIPYGEMTFRYG